MADLTWSASVSATYGGTYSTIPNLQNVVLNLGRNGVADQWRPSTATLSGRVPSSLPTININDYIKITYTGMTGYYAFRVADIVIEYDYVTAGDTWQIICESNLAAIGRSICTASVSAGTKTLEAARLVCFDAPVTIANPRGNGQSSVSAISVTKENPMTYLQDLLQTEQGFVQDTKDVNELYLLPRTAFSLSTVTFTDDNTATTTYKLNYNAIKFASLAENYVTGIVVSPVGLADQTAGTLSRSRSFNTYDQTTAQASNLASYIKIVLGQSATVPNMLVSNVKMWPSASAAVLGVLETGQLISVRLRATTYSCIIEGLTITADPQATIVQVRFSPATAYGFLRLDDSVFGRLNYNSLGF